MPLLFKRTVLVALARDEPAFVGSICYWVCVTVLDTSECSSLRL